MSTRDLPVTDAEREHIGEVLQRAVGRGLLTLAQFTERMDRALAAKTRAELNSVVVDLPGIRLSAPRVPGAAPQSAPPAPPADGPREVITARLNSVARS